MTQTFTVFPIRSSADPGAMIAFLEALGLSKEVEDQSGGWAVFGGASGKVAVRGTAGAARPAGHTALDFVVGEIDAGLDELRSAGLTATATTSVAPETPTSGGILRTPGGYAVGLRRNSDGDPPTGYRVHEQTIAASLDVVVVWYSTDFRRDAAFFAALGFQPFDDLDDRWWCSLRADPAQGVIGLHRAETEPEPAPAVDDPATSPPASVRLGFETSEPLDALAGRLVAAGYASATVLDDEVGTRVVVTDPDGQRLEIHPTT